MDKIISLCKRRGFIFPGSEIYGGLANSWDYGPLGTELKNNIKKLWWDRFVTRREDMFGLDAALIMNPKVWEASGHLGNFNDPLAECKKCKNRFRLDQLENPKVCPNCGGKLGEARQFNLMLKTFLGPAEEKANEVYFRPETAQAMFVNFKNILDSMRPRIPFGIAQIGKAFRNEITPGNFIFRTREFEQMEIEYFIAAPKTDKEWKEHFDIWLTEMRGWLVDVGIDRKKVHEVEIPDGDRAHYSKRTIDFEFEYPFGQKELYGLAYRTDFDLKNHFKEAPYKDPVTNKTSYPHVIEPSFGVDRTLLAALVSAYTEDGDRAYLKLKPKLAPYKAAVFPLLANKPHLVEAARRVYADLKKEFSVTWDDRGNVGKRYYAQDEIGTPYCITVDFDTLGEGDADKKGTVTVRDRDTAKQDRVKITELKKWLSEKINNV